MTLARAWAVTLVGLDGHVVEVEADLAIGLPGLALIGLPDASLHEARDRVRAAIVNSGEPWPQRRITVGLTPRAGWEYRTPRASPGTKTVRLSPCS